MPLSYVQRLAYFSVVNHSGWRTIERTLQTALYHSQAEHDLYERALRVLGADPITELAKTVRIAARKSGLIPNATTRTPDVPTVLESIVALTPEQVEEYAARVTPKTYGHAPKPLTKEKLDSLSPEERAELDLTNPPERLAIEAAQAARKFRPKKTQPSTTAQ